MLAKRIIPCLDIKEGRVVKGVNFVNLRDAGDPVEQARLYDAAGADDHMAEIIVLALRLDDQHAGAVARRRLEDLQRALAGVVVGGDAHGVDQAEVELARDDRRGRGVVDQHRALLHPGERPVRALHHRTQIVVIAHASKDEIRTLCGFRGRRRVARQGRNPQTGKPVQVPAKRVPYFKPGKELKALVDSWRPIGTVRNEQGPASPAFSLGWMPSACFSRGRAAPPASRKGISATR